MIFFWLFHENGITLFEIPSSDHDEKIINSLPFTPYTISQNKKGELFAHRTASSKDKSNPLVPICFKQKKGDERRIWAVLDFPDVPSDLLGSLAADKKALRISVYLNRKVMPPIAALTATSFEARFGSQGNPTLPSYRYPQISAIFDILQAPIISPASLRFVLPDTALQMLKDNHNIRLGIPGLPNTKFPVITAKQLMAHSLMESTPRDIIRFCLDYHENLIKDIEGGGNRASTVPLDSLKNHLARLQGMFNHGEGAILLHPYQFESFTKQTAVKLAFEFNSLATPISTLLFSPISHLSTSEALARELNPLLFHERLTLCVHYYLDPTIMAFYDAKTGLFHDNGPTALFALTETQRPRYSIPALFPELIKVHTLPEGPTPYYESDQEGRSVRGCFDGFIGLTRAAWAKHPVDKALTVIGGRLGAGQLILGSTYQSIYFASPRPSPNLSAFLQTGRRFGLFFMKKSEFTTPLVDNPLLCLLRLGATDGQVGIARTVKFLLQLGSAEVPLIACLAPVSDSVLKIALNPQWPQPSEAFSLLQRSLTYFNDDRLGKNQRIYRAHSFLCTTEKKSISSTRGTRAHL